ncbi:hypothetical protein SHELI_v1c09970 [Spiroplasma helicoides]|uniref:Uncharacterized protein n=1 Tax=Spiroplasma helicoides TaxID=216938 RepID=A0A1B3SLY9_9MOLU|nr:hypothetical protein [Spiroplasma helicoides]AOG60944.1 hypothetical protein SHELI_v1c09970 [Spiroplasma helicoides]
MESSANFSGSVEVSYSYQKDPELIPAFPESITTTDVIVGDTKSFDVTIKHGDSSTVLTATAENDTRLEEVSVVQDRSNKNKFTVSYKGKAAAEFAKITLKYGESLTKDIIIKVLEAPVIAAEGDNSTEEIIGAIFTIKVIVSNSIDKVEPEVSCDKGHNEYVTVSRSFASLGNGEWMYDVVFDKDHSPEGAYTFTIKYQLAKDLIQQFNFKNHLNNKFKYSYIK